ncbi:MAG: carboxypeptidase regulatory-like domain-containing protein [Bryobacteraceae bacterium]
MKRASWLSPLFWVALWAALTVVFLPVASAQQNGSITGIVSDPSGAVIPGANVTLINQASRDERKTLTNAEGFFNFVSVPSATYTVRVEMRGFRTWERKEIVMNLGDRRTLTDIAMQIESSPGETVNVTSTVESVTPVDSGEKAAVLSTKQLDNIAIVGRNAADFIKILPGMSMGMNGVQNQASYTGETMGVGAGPIGNFSANGTRSGAMDIVADGAHIIDPGCNCGQAVTTNQEMTEEVKVLTSNFGADNQKGPVVVTSVTKQGGKDFHGEAYFYARNYNMNANDWYNNKAGVTRPLSSYYYPGGNFGGPVLIPGTRFNKNRDKLFFFVGFELYRQNIDNGTLTAVVPSDAMRGGDFSQAAINAVDPKHLWGQIDNVPNGFPGGIVPKSQWDATGAGPIMMGLLAKPNADPLQTGGYNYVSGYLTYQNGYQLHPRVDYSISENTKLYVTWSRQRETGDRKTTLWWGNTQDVPYPSPLEQKNNADSISVNLTHVFSPTMTNEVIFTYTNLDLPWSFKDPAAIDPSKLGMNYKDIFGNDAVHEIPAYTGWGGGVATMLNPSGFQLTGSLYARKKLPTVSDNFSKVWGTHTIKAGFYWEKTGNNQPSSNQANGEWVMANWGGNSSNNAYADTLLGRIAQYSQTNQDVIVAMAYRSVQFYVQDSWKVNRRLTLDYGIRFDHLGGWWDEQGTGLAIWDAAKYNASAPATDLTGIEWHKRNSAIPLSGTPSRALFYDPRFGLAFDIFGTGKTVIRGGWGMYHFHDEQNVQSAALQVTSGTYSYCACNGILTKDIGSITPSQAVPGSITTLQLGDDRQPLTKTYSFTISQRAPWKSLFEASYVGNSSTDQNNWNTSFFNINSIPFLGEFSTGQWSSGGNPQPYRPYQNYQALNVAQHTLYQNYNSLQVSWNKQSGRFNFLMNYTFSKNLGIRLWSNEASNLNVRDNYGPLGLDHTHIFNVAYVYQMPDFYKGNPVLKGIVNGWQLSGITQVQSGGNLQGIVNANMNFSGFLQPGTVLPDGTTLTAAQGMNNENTLGTPDLQLEPIITCNPGANLKPNQRVNGACFAPPTLGHNGSYEWPYVKGPAFWNADLSLFKNFQINESKKVQLRFSGYNVLNHPLPSFLNSGDPNLNLTFNQQGVLSNPNFGYVTEKVGHRIIQLAIKFYF